MHTIIESLIKDNILEIQELADGNFSHGFIIIGERKKYFMRKFKHNVHGYEYPHDERWSFENSHLMMQLSGNSYQSYGVFEFENHFFHIQDHFDGKPIHLDQINDDIIRKTAIYISKLHITGKKVIQEFSLEKRQRIYTRSLREFITNFEGILPLFENSLESESFFKDFFQTLRNDFFALATKKSSERLTSLHGDFRFGNMLYNDSSKDLHFIDFSITPFGEAGIDIGWFIADFELWGLFGNTEKLQSYSKLFLETYLEHTGDTDITIYIPYMCKLKGLKLLSPLVQKYLNRNEEQKNTVRNWIKNLQ